MGPNHDIVACYLEVNLWFLSLNVDTYNKLPVARKDDQQNLE